MAQQIEIHIEELVLHGIQPGNRYQLAAAVQAELTNLLQQRGLQGANGQKGFDRIGGGQIHLPQRANDVQTGNAIAGNVFAAIQQTAKPKRRK
jgi:hypothetical protein